MNSIASGLTRHEPSEVVFGATVTSAPHFFYGTYSHATHEAFDVRSDDGHALEIVDNVALAPRLPVAVGDHIAVRGELVPQTTRGPLVHWTHHDPQHIHADGYIDFNGKRYA